VDGVATSVHKGGNGDPSVVAGQTTASRQSEIVDRQAGHAGAGIDGRIAFGRAAAAPR
jgi:hypothetical protein